MKRAVWDYEVHVRVVMAREPGASADRKAGVITFGVQQLLHLQFFANLPLPEDADVVSVDLVQSGMSPFPVCKDALEALVELCGPFGMRPDSSLLQELDRRSCSPLMLLLCADALCLTTVARAALDRWFAHMLECTPSLLELQAGGNFTAFGRNEHDCCDNLELSCRWRSDGVLETQLMPAWNKAACPIRASAVLPAVRWAAMELYKLLDVLCLSSSQEALAAMLFDPQSAVLHADEEWQRQLLDLATTDQLSGPGRRALIAAGFASNNGFTGGFFGNKQLTLTVREVLTSGVLLDKGVRMGYDSTSRGCLLPYVIITDYSPDEF